MKGTAYATITIELSKAGIHAYCEEIGEDVFCIGNDLDPLVELINTVEELCSPNTRFSITEKGEEYLDTLLIGTDDTN